MNRVTYVDNREALMITNLKSTNHFLINLHRYLTPENINDNLPLEAIYELVKSINDNVNIYYYLILGFVIEDLHEDIDNLINKLIYHTGSEQEEYIDMIKEELNKLTNFAKEPSYEIKVRFNGLFLLIAKTLRDNPSYRLSCLDVEAINTLININNL